MNERKLMQALVAAARRSDEDARRLDELLDALASGQLTTEQRDALQRYAGSADAADRLENLSTPLDQNFRDAVTERILQEFGADAGDAPPARGQVVTLRPRKRRRGGWVPSALAASALLAVGLFVFRGNPDVPAALPPYDLTLHGAVTALRSGSQPAPGETQFRDGNSFELLLVPDTAVDTALELQLYTYAGNELRRLPAPAAQTTSRGVITIEGEVGRDVLLPPGASTLVVIVAATGAAPDARRLRRLLADDARLEAPGWRGWRIPLQVR